jgi:hypothetical protein
VTSTGTAARVVDALCPLRPGQPCTLCHPETFLGPSDCPTVAIVMDDPDLRAEVARLRRRHREATRRPR